MSKKDKLIARLKTNPKDFTFDEAETLLGLCGYALSKSGKTSGSSVKFKKGNNPIMLHKPHPGNELLEYQIKLIIKTLKKEGLI
ncbi:MAG: type II toxin-antitoxin system HicA family toxin [Oscillospiraceae bacterium]|nr:type II toxin-antitoxin system HicA family toxin [Oscillospiraceae bacterium]